MKHSNARKIEPIETENEFETTSPSLHSNGYRRFIALITLVVGLFVCLFLVSNQFPATTSEPGVGAVNGILAGIRASSLEEK